MVGSTVPMIIKGADAIEVLKHLSGPFSNSGSINNKYGVADESNIFMVPESYFYAVRDIENFFPDYRYPR